MYKNSDLFNDINKEDYVNTCILGLEKNKWSGRFELFKINGFNIILDGAHNDNGMKSLVESLKELPQKKGYKYICM